MTLIMTVESPQDGMTVETSPITVSGTVNKTAEVKINDVVVPIKGGKFSTHLKLAEGTNVISVVGISGAETVKKELTITCKLTKQ